MKENSEFIELATEIKKWFESRDIDIGYTDTNVGHFALFIQEKLKIEREEILKLFPPDFCNDGEYSETEMIDCLSGVIKEVYKKISERI